MIMQCKKIINLLDNTPNQPSKFKTKTWVETNDARVERVIPIVKSNLKPQTLNFKKSSLCNYNDVYILVSEAKKITGRGAD